MASKELWKLDPTTFENMIFDLMVLKGLRNVHWRTPGADGGRDIEADELQIDIANTQVIRKWYIECKKYKTSVDWPTVFSKLAYAESQSADFLLMCSTSKFTPAAITQVEIWNKIRGRVQIRLWPGHEILHQIKPYFDLRVKYGIDPAPVPQGDKLANLSLAVTKSIQSFYGKLVFSETPIDPMIKGAQSISLLIQQRLEDLKTYGKQSISPFDIQTLFERDVDSHEPCLFDRYAYEALISYLHALSCDDFKIDIVNGSSCRMIFSEDGAKLFRRYEETFAAILYWGDIEWNFLKKTLTLVQRNVLP